MSFARSMYDATKCGSTHLGSQIHKECPTTRNRPMLFRQPMDHQSLPCRCLVPIGWTYKWCCQIREQHLRPYDVHGNSHWSMFACSSIAIGSVRCLGAKLWIHFLSSAHQQNAIRTRLLTLVWPHPETRAAASPTWAEAKAIGCTLALNPMTVPVWTVEISLAKVLAL